MSPRPGAGSGTGAGAIDPALIRSTHRRVRAVLITGQVLAGLGMGSTLSAGALLAVQVSGDEAWSGMAATMSTLGAAIAAVPLAGLAVRRGRAFALAGGALTAAVGAALGIVATLALSFPLLLVSFAMIGVGTAVNLQSRFAATDLSEPGSRGRDLSIVVWATTVGAVIGPNLISVGDELGRSIGLPTLSGAYLFTIAAQCVATVIYLVGLRPDPLRLAARIRASAVASGTGTPDGVGDRFGVITGVAATALSHATMVSVMSMTPVHLTSHGAGLEVVGLTISLHVAGMFALSPVFGVLADRLGRPQTIAVGQGLLIASLLMTGLGSENEAWVVAGLITLGLGWSASTVAGSALVSESARPERRTVIQGRSDLIMSATAALAGASSGPVLSAIGFPGLSFVAMALVALVVSLLAVRGTVTRGRTLAEPVT